MQFRAGSFCVEVQSVQAPNGLWLMSTNYQSSLSGSGYACSVWSRIAFPSGEDARLAGIDELLTRFRQDATRQCSSENDAHRRDREQMIRLLDAERTPQLALF